MWFTSFFDLALYYIKENLKLGMAILPCLAWPVPPFFIWHGFSLPLKGGGAGLGWDFSLTSWGRTRMGIDFLDLSHPIPSLIRVIIVNFFYTLISYYLNKHINISLFYSTQSGFLPLFCHMLYYGIFVFVVILSC